MKVNIIVAMNDDGVIGIGNKIPWNIKEDMAHFKNMTNGHFCIMGRLTWDSLPKKPLKNRTNVVVSKNNCKENDVANNTYWFNDFEYALNLSKAMAGLGQQDIWIIGGSKIYEAAMPFVTHLHITHVNEKVEGKDLVLFNPYLEDFVEEHSSQLAPNAIYKRYRKL